MELFPKTVAVSDVDGNTPTLPYIEELVISTLDDASTTKASADPNDTRVSRSDEAEGAAVGTVLGITVGYPEGRVVGNAEGYEDG